MSIPNWTTMNKPAMIETMPVGQAPDGFLVRPIFVNHALANASAEGMVRMAFGEVANGVARLDTAIIMSIETATQLRDLLAMILSQHAQAMQASEQMKETEHGTRQ